MEYALSSKGLVVNESGEVLMLVRSMTDPKRPGDYDLPGGLADPGEDPVSAFTREVLEETGLEVVDVQKVREGTKISNGITKRWAFCIGKVANDEVVLSTEHSEYLWQTPKDAYKTMTFEPLKNSIGYVLSQRLL